MGRTYDLICKDCKVKLWVGQNNASSSLGWLYTGPQLAGDGEGHEEDASKKLWLFLREHEGHALVFLDDENELSWESKEFDRLLPTRTVAKDE